MCVRNETGGYLPFSKSKNQVSLKETNKKNQYS